MFWLRTSTPDLIPEWLFIVQAQLTASGVCVVEWAPRAPSWLSYYFVRKALHKRIWQIDLNHGFVPSSCQALPTWRRRRPGEKFLFIGVFLATREGYDAVRGAANNCRVLCTHWKKGTLSYKLLFPLEDNLLQKINCQSSEKCYRWDISLGEDAWLTLNTNQASSEAARYSL